MKQNIMFNRLLEEVETCILQQNNFIKSAKGKNALPNICQVVGSVTCKGVAFWS
jgi:hypothetical protein